jgi:hypothetical protein
MDALMAECPDKLRCQERLQRWLQRNAGIASVQTNSHSELPAFLTCDQCSTRFTGGNRSTNFSRLKKQCKHGKAYPCKVPECSKVYRRNDTRVKHYNKNHLERGNFQDANTVLHRYIILYVTVKTQAPSIIR